VRFTEGGIFCTIEKLVNPKSRFKEIHSLNLRNMTTKFSLAFAILVLIVGISACIEPVPEPSADYKIIPMTLQKSELPDGSVRLEWSKTKSFEFKEYWVARSLDKDSVPYISELPKQNGLNTAILPPVEVMSRIEDVDSTSFVDSITFFNQKVSYRLFAVLNGRVVSSPSVTVAKKINSEEFNFVFDDIVPVPERRQLLLIDRTGARVSLYRPMENFNIVSMTQNVGVGAEITYRISSNTPEAVDIVFPSRGSASIRNFTNPNFSTALQGNFFLNNVFFNGVSFILDSTNMAIAAPGGNGFSSVSTSFFSINRSNTPNVIASRAFTLPFSVNFQTTFKKNPLAGREAIAFTPLNDKIRLQAISWLSIGAITIDREVEIDPSLFAQQPFAFSKDNQVFITDTEGVVYDEKTLQSPLQLKAILKQEYTDYSFSEDGKRLYALRVATNNRQNRFVDVFNYPSFTFDKSISFTTRPTRLFQFGTQLLLIGRSPNSNFRTIVERINL
jgi:hypothetical protein